MAATRTVELERLFIYEKGSSFLPHISEGTMVVSGAKGGMEFPLAYIHRPLWLSDEQWLEIRERLEIRLKR